VLLIAGTGLRLRKLRRDDMRDLSRPTDRRLVVPPPSPYAPSKGFRLLDGPGDSTRHHEIERPRLDPDRHYVFSESAHANDETIATHLRHNDDWFLSRTTHRSALSSVFRVLLIVVLVGLIVGVVAIYYTKHDGTKTPSGQVSNQTTTTSTTVSTTTSTTTTTVPFPTSFSPTSTSGDDASYSVPAPKYVVTVNGTLGATWAVYNMGPNNTLEWQGTVEQGHSKSLTMTGNSRITIGSPSSATVSVGGSPVAFPTPLPPTLILVLSSTTSSSTK
jgi:hypothetical protein